MQRAEVERLAVHEHAVEVEDGRARVPLLESTEEYIRIVLIKSSPAALFASFVFSLFRLAMGLRGRKIAREGQRGATRRRAAAACGRDPAAEDGLVLLLEDADAFHWGAGASRRPTSWAAASS